MYCGEIDFMGHSIKGLLNLDSVNAFSEYLE